MLIILASICGFFLGVIAGILWPFLQFFYFLPAILLPRKIFIFFFVSFAFGIFRVDLYESDFPNLPFGEIELIGKVTEEIDKREDYQNVYFETELGIVLVKTDIFRQIYYGDTFLISGELEAPSDEEGFSYKNYLARYGVFSLIKNPKLQLLQPAQPSFFLYLYKLKALLQLRINQLYPEPEAAFVSGLLLGSRKGMSEDISDAFKAVGLTHIVAISGYNISLIILLIFSSFSFVRLKLRVILSIFLITIFILLVGLSAAVVRAAIMGFLTLWALYGGMKSQVYFALLWSMVFMVLFNPYILFYDVGFQLSFASTFGLISFSAVLKKYFPKMNESLALTLSAQILTIPFIAFSFGRISIISPLANLIVAPFIPIAMLLSGLSLICGKIVALPAIFFLGFVLETAQVLAKIPLATLEIKFDSFLFVFSFVVLGRFFLQFYKQELVRAFRPAEFFYKSDRSAFEKHERQ